MTFGVGHEGLQHAAGWQLDVVHGVAAEVGDVVHDAFGPVVARALQFRQLGADQEFFRANRVGDLFVLGAGTDAVA